MRRTPPTPPPSAKWQHQNHFLRLYYQYQPGVRSVFPVNPGEHPINPNVYYRFVPGPGSGEKRDDR